MKVDPVDNENLGQSIIHHDKDHIRLQHKFENLSKRESVKMNWRKINKWERDILHTSEMEGPKYFGCIRMVVCQYL